MRQEHYSSSIAQLWYLSGLIRLSLAVFIYRPICLGYTTAGNNWSIQQQKCSECEYFSHGSLLGKKNVVSNTVHHRPHVVTWCYCW